MKESLRSRQCPLAELAPLSLSRKSPAYCKWTVTSVLEAVQSRASLKDVGLTEDGLSIGTCLSFPSAYKPGQGQ